ncbi:MAG TPA: DEAD/DEAH box helicase [Acidimicrobiales bacterium]|nr:DEAD/DEAH box helicase [Acidimicrobiales bacterium]
MTAIYERASDEDAPNSPLDDSDDPTEGRTETYDPNVTFEGLGVAKALARLLVEQGIRKPFPIQALTIPDGIAGRDVCGKAKTGSGKTLAFGLPLLMRVGKAVGRTPRALVLVPTRELAVQVAEVLAPLAESVDRKVVVVYGGADIERQIKRIRKGCDVVIATPGRLIDLTERGEVSLAEVEVAVLDEADRMADMGFLPQVDWLLRRIEKMHQTMLFSATLDGDVDRVVRRHLSDPIRHEVESAVPTVESMQHYFFQVHQMDKVKVASAICRGARKALVFVRTKRGADRLVEQLRREGVRADAIHGDLRQASREKALQNFSSDKVRALVATDVAARGLDIEDVDVVVHYDPPEDQKAYLHRSGRTARAGGSGAVATLVLWDQILDVERIQRRLGLHLPIVEVFSNDARLTELTGSAVDDAVEEEETA